MVLMVLALGACSNRIPRPVVEEKNATAITPQTPAELAHDAYAAALQTMKKGKPAQAEDALLELTRQYPELPGPYANLGLLYMQDGRLQEAEQAFREAIERNPGNARFYDHLGIVYRRSGRFTEARDAYEKALAIDADYADAHLNLGILFDLYLADYTQAKAHYLRARELLPNDRHIEAWLIDLEKRAQAKGAK